LTCETQKTGQFRPKAKNATTRLPSQPASPASGLLQRRATMRKITIKMGSKASNASMIVELYQKWRGKAKPVQGLTFMAAGTDGKNLSANQSE